MNLRSTYPGLPDPPPAGQQGEVVPIREQIPRCEPT